MSKIVVVTSQDHQDLRWKRSSNRAFTKQDAFCPLSVSEVILAVPSIPIGFIKHQDQFLLVALQGLEPQVNLFVDSTGRWRTRYCPEAYAYYPFCLVRNDDEYALCVDEESDLVQRGGDGDALFSATGEQTPLLEQLLKSLAEHNNGRQQAAKVCAQLAEFDLLIPWEITIEKQGNPTKVNGLYRIDETKLNELDGEQLLKMRDSSALLVAYSQLLSIIHLKYLHRVHTDSKAAADALEKDILFDEGGTLNFDNL